MSSFKNDFSYVKINNNCINDCNCMIAVDNIVIGEPVTEEFALLLVKWLNSVDIDELDDYRQINGYF